MNIELDLDLGLDDGPSIEIGRKANPSISLADDVMGDENDFAKDLGYDENTRTRLSSRVPSLIEDWTTYHQMMVVCYLTTGMTGRYQTTMLVQRLLH